MACLELGSTFAQKSRVFALSALGGITARERGDMQIIVDHGYRSPQAFSNPPLDQLEYDFFEQVKHDMPSRDSYVMIPWANKGFSKGIHLTNMVAFTDQHAQPFCPDLFPAEKSIAFVETVMTASDIAARQITLPEQLRIALGLTENHLLAAAVVAHAGSRAIAKRSDLRVSPQLDFPLAMVHKWKDCVSNFEAITGEYGGPPADTYHFWGSFVYGLVSQMKLSRKDIILDPMYRFIYTHIAELTEVLRYKLARKGDGTVHKEADLVGFHLGSLLSSLVLDAAR